MTGHIDDKLDALNRMEIVQGLPSDIVGHLIFGVEDLRVPDPKAWHSAV